MFNFTLQRSILYWYIQLHIDVIISLLVRSTLNWHVRFHPDMFSSTLTRKTLYWRPSLTQPTPKCHIQLYFDTFSSSTEYKPFQRKTPAKLSTFFCYLVSNSSADTLDTASPSLDRSFSILVMRCFSFSCVLLKSERRRAKRVERLSRVDSSRSSFCSMVTFFSISWRTASCKQCRQHRDHCREGMVTRDMQEGVYSAVNTEVIAEKEW